MTEAQFPLLLSLLPSLFIDSYKTPVAGQTWWPVLLICLYSKLHPQLVLEPGAPLWSSFASQLPVDEKQPGMRQPASHGLSAVITKVFIAPPSGSSYYCVSRPLEMRLLPVKN